jgi:hypothetical protein
MGVELKLGMKHLYLSSEGALPRPLASFTAAHSIVVNTDKVTSIPNSEHYRLLRCPRAFFLQYLQVPPPRHLDPSRQLSSCGQYPSGTRHLLLVECLDCCLLLKYGSHTLRCFQETCSSRTDQYRTPPLPKVSMLSLLIMEEVRTRQTSAGVVTVGTFCLGRVQILLSFGSNVEKVLAFILLGHDGRCEETL